MNYVLRDGTPNTPPAFSVQQTGGSNGLFDSYASVAGGAGQWTYFAYGQYRHLQGWRANGDLTQFSGAGHATYQATDRLRFTFGYSLLRNRIHMPGGLDDAEFDTDPRASFRARNWIATPWNILSTSAELKLSSTSPTPISTKSGSDAHRDLGERCGAVARQGPCGRQNRIFLFQPQTTIFISSTLTPVVP